jgi:putative transposase
MRNINGLRHEDGIGISHATVPFWWNRIGPTCAAGIRRKRGRAA